MNVGIIGYGLIGGSVAAGLRSRHFADRIVVVDTDPEARSFAAEHADHVSDSIDDRLGDCDVIVVATTVPHIVGSVQAAREFSKATITDVGSVKLGIATALSADSRFVPGHPIAGKSRAGAAHADPELFAGRRTVLTPNGQKSPESLALISAMWRALGATVVKMEPSEHDRIFGAVSHLPQVLAYALIASIAEADVPFAGPGLVDTTRLSQSDPNLWADIVGENRVAVGQAIARFDAEWAILRAAILRDDRDALREHFARASQRRAKLDSETTFGPNS